MLLLLFPLAKHVINQFCQVIRTKFENNEQTKDSQTFACALLVIQTILISIHSTTKEQDRPWRFISKPSNSLNFGLNISTSM